MNNLKKNLKHSIDDVVKNLKKGRIYSDEIYLRYSRQSKSVLISKNDTNATLYYPKALDEIFEENEVKSASFYDLGRDVKKAKHVANFSKMIYNRAMVEIAKKLPFPKFKNRIYRSIKINLPDISSVIIAPNVLLDYIHPQLLSIKPGNFVGEEAIISTHYFTPKKFKIGIVDIGHDCLVGARSVIGPGTSIGDNSQIGINTVVLSDVNNGSKLLPNSYHSAKY